MNGVRLLFGTASGLNVYGAKLMRLPQGGKSTQLMISRVYSQGERETVWKTSRARRQTFAEVAAKPSRGTAISIGQGAVAGASVFGLGALAYYGLGFSNQAGILENSMLWPQYVRDRVRNTYMYFGGSLLLSAGGALITLRTPFLFNLVCRNSLTAAFVTMAAMMSSGMVTMALEYAPNFNAKHIAWAFHSCLIGGVLAPMTLIGGPAVVKALWYTAGICGGLTTMAVCAPNDKFLTFGGTLAMGLGAVFVASIGSAFFPPTTALGSGLLSISLYGGLIIFSGLLLYDTQRVVRNAESHPLHVPTKYDPVQFPEVHPLHVPRGYDPINECLSIYLDVMNIFIRLVAIFSGNGGKKR